MPLAAPRRVAASSFMRMLAKYALRRLFTSSAARFARWVWSKRLERVPPSRSDPGEERARRTRLSHMGFPAHRRMPRGPQESKEVVVRTMLPSERKVPAACQTRWTPYQHRDLAPLPRWLTG